MPRNPSKRPLIDVRQWRGIRGESVGGLGVRGEDGEGEEESANAFHKLPLVWALRFKIHPGARSVNCPPVVICRLLCPSWEGVGPTEDERLKIRRERHLLCCFEKRNKTYV